MDSGIKLCSYEDSEDDSEEEEKKELSISVPENDRSKRKLDLVDECPAKRSKEDIVDSPSDRRLPLPPSFLPPSSLDSADGRVRTFAHERGVWASHVYVPFADDDEELVELRDAVVAEAERLLELHVRPFPLDELHLSLSRTFVLAHHLIPTFVTAVAKAMLARAPPRATTTVALTDIVRIYLNDEKTRGFVAVEVDDSSQRLLRRLSSAVDETLVDFNCGDDVFYKDPSFHLSLGWFLPDSSAGKSVEGFEPRRGSTLDVVETRLTSTLSDFFADNGVLVTQVVDAVLLKTGNRIHRLPFDSQRKVQRLS